MSQDINTYLDDLRRALGGADPAVIHDALYDAEEHLRSELAAAQASAAGAAPGAVAGTPRTPAFDADSALAGIMEAYGTPEEVAAAYLEAEGLVVPAGAVVPGAGGAPAATSGTPSEPALAPAATGGQAATGAPSSVLAAAPVIAPAPSPTIPSTPRPSVASSVTWASFLGVVTDQRTWLSLLYMLLTFGTGIAYFTWVVTGLSLSAGLAVLIIGIPFALFFLASVRGISFVEGRLVEALLGVRMPRRPSFGPTDPSIVQRILYWLRDRRTWTTMLYLLLQMPLGIAYFTIVVAGLATSVSLMVSPVLYVLGGMRVWEDSGESWQITWNGDPLPSWSIPAAVLVGLSLLLGMLHLIRLIGRLHGAYAKAMLVRFGQEPASGPAGTPAPATPSGGAGGPLGPTGSGEGDQATLSAPAALPGGTLAGVECAPPVAGVVEGLRWMPVEGDAKSLWR